jgi:hypothetical protein
MFKAEKHAKGKERGKTVGDDTYKVEQIRKMLRQAMRAHKRELRQVLHLCELPPKLEGLEQLHARLELHLEHDNAPRA